MPARSKWNSANFGQLPQIVRNSDKVAGLRKYLPKSAQIAYNSEAKEDCLGWEHPLCRKWKWFLIDEAICQKCGVRPISETTRLKPASGLSEIVWTDSAKTHCNQCWASKKKEELTMARFLP
jgi:hypothetical protein